MEFDRRGHPMGPDSTKIYILLLINNNTTYDMSQ